jgi:hypothetical protein
MKKYVYILLFIAMPFISACDNLDLNPEDFYGAGNFWKEKGQVEAYLIGLHRDIRDSYKNYFIYGEARGGTLLTGVSSIGTSLDYEVIKLNRLSQDTYGIGNWGDFYTYLLQVNHAIDNLENNCSFLSATDLNYYKGQVYGLRAFYYFWLYRSYGGVPLETDVKVANGTFDVTDLYLERASAEATLQQIKDDLQQSETSFESTQNSTFNSYFWSEYATQMLKAEVYMWSAKVTTGDHIATGNSDLQIAKAALSNLIGKFSLAANYADLFNANNKAAAKTESIFTLYFDKKEATNWGDYFVYSSAQFIGQSWDKNGNLYQDPLDLCGSGLLRHEYKESFIKSFDEDDSRRSVTFLEYYRDENLTMFGASLKKILGTTDSGKRYYDSDIHIYRYADALLMMAEVENGLSGHCADYINQVRERAYGKNYAQVYEYKDGSYAENELAILKERDKEFVSEGKRWFDVIRLHDDANAPLVFSVEAAYATAYGEKVTPILDKNSESYKLLWPIEKTLIDRDPKLEQTPGYKN